jgi:glycosyltransferase involved in cell wall biosynthesis
MKICLATYEGVPLARGGPFVKITEIKKHLEFMGHEVSLFNMWETDFSSRHYDIIHLVGSNFSIYGLARNLKFREKNFLIEPVFYSNRSALIIKSLSTIDKVLRNFVSGIWFDHAILRDICNWAELIVPNTSAEKELLLKSFEIPAQKFEIIPNGVSEKFIDSNPSVFEKKFGIKDFILSVGHIGPEGKIF